MKKNIVINADVSRFWGKSEKGQGTILVPAVITLLVMGIIFYFELPAINLKSAGFWVFILVGIILYTVIKIIVCAIRKKSLSLKAPVLTFLAVLVAFTALALESTRIFHAKRYSRILTVEQGDADLIPSVSGSSSIALMDTASAEMLGDRKIGSLSSVVSQFNVGSYMQINYQDAPYKVAALEYDGFFKWNANKDKGIPGYVIVNPVNMSADYVSLDEPMRYVPSAYFGQNLYRRIRFAYPSLMFSNLHFEIDENGKPWYVASIINHTIGLFGGTDVTGALIIDPVSGEMTKVSIEDVPVWADIVKYGDLICTQFNDSAQLQHGFLNRLFSQKDCRQVTTIRNVDEDGDTYSVQDYGYIAKDGDIWIYTGITSLNGDSSNLGFILSNERTAETKYITCAGADEFSGMRSAEGEVQEKGYTASFPSLINVNGTPTYIMVLKDASGLVKMYAAVNVEQYNIVATATTQADCIEKYRKLLNDEITPEEANNDTEVIDTTGWETKEITIRKIETIDRGGDTYIYVVDEENHIYNAKYADVIGMILVEQGDTVTILTDGERFLLQE